MTASVQLYEPQTTGLLHAVLESATNAAVVYDAERDAYLANHQALELHGLPPASMPFDEWGVYYEARWPGGVTALQEELPLARACRGETVPELRLEIRPRRGNARTVEVRAMPLRDADGQLIGAMSIFRDVEGTEAEMQAARMRSAVTANMAEGVTVIRAADGQIVYVNEVVERTFGYEPGEMIGRNATTLTAPDQVLPRPPPRRSRMPFAGTESGTERSRTCARTAPGSGAGPTCRASITPRTASCGWPSRLT